MICNTADKSSFSCRWRVSYNR